MLRKLLLLAVLACGQALGADVSVMSFGAKGDCSTNDAPAIIKAISAGSGGTVLFPNPKGGCYKLAATLGTIPANTRLQGVNKQTAKLQRAFNGTQLMQLSDGVSIDSLYLEGDGANFSGKGIIIAGTDGNQSVTNSRIINFNGNPVEFTATTAGSRSNWVNVEAYQTGGTTGTGKYAFVNANAVQLTAVPKSFVHIETSGNCSFDFGGSSDVFIVASFLGDLSYTANTRGVNIVGTRVANQANLTIQGSNNAISGSDIAPNLTFSGVGPFAFQGNTYNGTITDSSNNTTNVIDAYSVAYTPTWTGSAVNPAIGNGSLTAEYTRKGDTITLSINLQIGTTTTLGTGDWRFSIPVAPNLPTSGVIQYGIAFLNQSGVTTRIDAARILNGGTFIQINALGTLNLVGAAVPWAWANGDALRIQMTYQL